MKQALEYIITQIAGGENKVKIEETEQDGIIDFKVFVDKDVMGRVIGKEGKIIRAIRTVMRIPAMKQEKRINVNLEEASIE
jgi:hypothetical protein